jgi:two-component system chemotaxis response regulator CheV
MGHPEENRSLIDTVDARTQLAGSNRMEILLFEVGTNETFGINVFKVREVSKTPVITKTPNMSAGVEGLISLRGSIIPVVSLGKVMKLSKAGDGLGGAMMVAEYSKRTLGFLVNSVDRIIRVEWGKVHAPSSNQATAGPQYITAITELPDGKLVSILDVEQILADTFGDAQIGHIDPLPENEEANVFFVDDSSVARKKIAEVLDGLKVKHRYAQNGQEAWTRLSSMAASAAHSGRRLGDEISVILVDAEMPEMDGYVLTKNIKADLRFDGIPVVMHSSLSSEANRAMGRSVGVDSYVAKFDAEILADTLRPFLMKSL